MKQATLDDLSATTRAEVTATFDATGLITNVCDAGVGRCFTAMHIGTALVAGTTLTFNGYGGGDNESSAPTAASLDLIRVENKDGSAVASYTLEVINNAGVYPLSNAEFKACRYLAIVSDEATNATKTITLVSQPARA